MLGRRCVAPVPDSPTPEPNTTTSCGRWAVPERTKPGALIARPRTHTDSRPKSTRDVDSCGGSRLAEAEVRQVLLSMPLTARASYQTVAPDERNAAGRRRLCYRDAVRAA